MAGDRETRHKGELFDLLSEGGVLRLTAMTSIEWVGDRSLIDAVLFGIADGKRPVEVAQENDVSVQQVWAWVRKSGDDELLRRASDSD